MLYYEEGIISYEILNVLLEVSASIALYLIYSKWWYTKIFLPKLHKKKVILSVVSLKVKSKQMPM